MGHVGFGLVVVVIRHEILDGIVGEELFEFGGELGGQGFVVGHHDGRPLDFLNDVGHGERFAAAGHAQHGLEDGAVIDALRQPGHRLRLIAGHLEIGD